MFEVHTQGAWFRGRPRRWSGRPGGLGRVAGMALAALAGGTPSDAALAQVPPVNPFKCVEFCGDDAPSSGQNGQSNSSGGLSNLLDRLAEQRREAQARRRAAAHERNERGVAAFQREDYVEALKLFRQAESDDPDSAVIRQNVKNAEAALAGKREEAKQREALRKEQEAFRQEARKISARMPEVRVLPPRATQDRKVPPLGFPADRWRSYLEAQEAVDLLYDKLNRGGVLSDTEAQVFLEALRRRNALWAEAQGRPLGDADRDRLRVPLPVTVSRGLAPGAAPPEKGPPTVADRRAVATPSRADALTTAFVADHLSDQLREAGEGVVADAVEAAHGEAAKGHFEGLLGAARVTVKAARGEAGEAGAELVDFVVSRLPEPLMTRAELAKAGGRVYSDVAFRALDRFMVDAMSAAGNASFDPAEFRKRVREDLSQGQKGVGAWASGE